MHPRLYPKRRVRYSWFYAAWHEPATNRLWVFGCRGVWIWA